MSDITQEIQSVLDPILADLGLSLWDLEFKKDGPKWLLRIYIDRDDGGATLDDCEKVSRDLGTALDVEDIITHAYTLEVSSPGLDRSLSRPEHYSKCIGRLVRIKTYEPIDGQKVFRGVLKAWDGSEALIESDQGKDMSFPIDRIAKASLEVVI